MADASQCGATSPGRVPPPVAVGIVARGRSRPVSNAPSSTAYITAPIAASGRLGSRGVAGDLRRRHSNYVRPSPPAAMKRDHPSRSGMGQDDAKQRDPHRATPSAYRHTRSSHHIGCWRFVGTSLENVLGRCKASQTIFGRLKGLWSAPECFRANETPQSTLACLRVSWRATDRPRVSESPAAS